MFLSCCDTNSTTFFLDFRWPVVNGGARDNNFSHPFDDQPLRMLLNFLNRIDRGAKAPRNYYQ
jgi:hypothetical protein